MADSNTGVWLDTDSGKVVKSQPVNGRLLVAAGHEVDAAAQAVIDRYGADHATKVDEVDPVSDASFNGDQTDDEAKTVTTAKVPAKKGPAKG